MAAPAKRSEAWRSLASGWAPTIEQVLLLSDDPAQRRMVRSDRWTIDPTGPTKPTSRIPRGISPLRSRTRQSGVGMANPGRAWANLETPARSKARLRPRVLARTAAVRVG